MTEPWVAPDACTLPTVEQPLRMAEFDALFADNVVRVERPNPTSVLMHLQGAPTLADHVRDLTNRETACCSFFSFAITQSAHNVPGALRLEIGVPASRSDVLQALADRAELLHRHQ